MNKHSCSLILSVCVSSHSQLNGTVIVPSFATWVKVTYQIQDVSRCISTRCIKPPVQLQAAPWLNAHPHLICGMLCTPRLHSAGFTLLPWAASLNKSVGLCFQWRGVWVTLVYLVSMSSLLWKGDKLPQASSLLRQKRKRLAHGISQFKKAIHSWEVTSLCLQRASLSVITSDCSLVAYQCSFRAPSCSLCVMD